jgi:membrane associated rhomboid family serine protease/Zn-finger nucleic acid-binding protein
MFTCPRCSVMLSKRMSPSLGLTWVCPSCRGRALTLEALRHVVPSPLVNRLWQSARTGQYPAVRRCPACRRLMAEVPVLAAESRTLYLDVCTGCHFVWFDTREFETLPKIRPELPAYETLSPKAKEALALARLETLKQQSQAMDVADPPDHWWQFAIAMLGIPIEYNDTPLRNRPLVTWLLTAVIAGVSLAAMGNLKAAVENWGLIPAEFGRHYGLTFLTSFLLHAGLFHLIGNLYFLVVFGDNAEDVLGKWRYLLLVATAALVGDIAHILVDPRATVPCVGASGGISGILAYYCLRFPTARVGIVWWFHWIRLPVGIMFALWVASQIFSALWISSGFGNVAVFAHLGEAAIGVLFWGVDTTGGFSRRAATGGLVRLNGRSQALRLRRRRRCFCLRIFSAFTAAGLFAPRVLCSSNSHIRLRA